MTKDNYFRTLFYKLAVDIYYSSGVDFSKINVFTSDAPNFIESITYYSEELI